MNHSVKSKTIRHDCHLLVRAEQNHLKTLVFLFQLFKLNRHKLDFIRVEELFFLFGFAKIIGICEGVVTTARLGCVPT